MVVPLEFYAFWTRRKAEVTVISMNLRSRGREQGVSPPLTAYAVYDRWHEQVVNAD
jgi:hypothetical protein